VSAGGCHCGAVVVMVTELWPGELHVCRWCGSVLIFDYGQRWRPATIVEILSGPPEELALLAAVSRAVVKLRSRTAGAGGMVN
jgi:hypothetical protein